MQNQGGGGEGGGQPPPNAAQQPAPAARQIAIPSYREVQQAERARTAPPNLFRPGGAGVAAATGAAVAPPPNSACAATAFLDGGGNSMAAQRPQYAPPQPQAPAMNIPPPPQQQQWQHNLAHGAPPHPPYYSSSSAGAGQQSQRGGPPPPPSAAPCQPRLPPQQGSIAAPTGAPQMPIQQEQLPPVDPNVITVSRRQQGNPVLKYVRNVRWQYGDIIPDYVAGQSTALLFLSLRYHLLKPEYVHSRMKEVGRAYRLRVLLVHIDTEDSVEALAQVTRAAVGNEFTLLCGFSNQECARYLETLKIYEKKPAELIQKDLGSDYVTRATSALTTVRGVNRTDVKTLGDKFGSIAAMFQADEAQLKSCTGVGPVKAKRLYEIFHEPFRRTIMAAPAPAGGGGAGVMATVPQQQELDILIAQDEDAIEDF